jgi:hypothetical protein
MADRSKRNTGAENAPTRPVQKRRAGANGSGSHDINPPCKLFPRGIATPVVLGLELDSRIKGGPPIAVDQLNWPTLLVHSQDPNYACSWFSRPIDFGEKTGSLAFWMLQKTSRTSWQLSLHWLGEQLATYVHGSTQHGFPFKMTRKPPLSRMFKKWPRTVTIKVV